MLGAIAIRMDGGRDGHHNGWHAVAHGVDVSFPEVTGTGVVEDTQVPDSEEEVQTLQEHPGEAGKEEVVEKACRDGARQLDGGNGGHAGLPSVTTVWSREVVTSPALGDIPHTPTWPQGTSSRWRCWGQTRDIQMSLAS